MVEKFRLKILRGRPGHQYWETFEFELTASANVISALQDIRRNPINIKGEKTTPVVWQDGCLEEVCGSCSMLINGYPRQSCSCVIRREIERTGDHEITLAPFTKFPLVRDLLIDRSSMFDSLKKIQGWVDCDGTWDSGPGEKIAPDKQEVMYSLSTCMVCGCCSEGCPQVNDKSKFMGPAAVSQVRYFNANPIGAKHKKKRLDAMMGEEGINGCGQAQNCVRVCPKNIPLTDSIAVVYRDVTKEAFRKLFSFPDQEL